MRWKIVFTGEDRRGDELPAELRRRKYRDAKIEVAMQRLKARQVEEGRRKGRHDGDGWKSPRGGRKLKWEFGKPDDKAPDKLTDPEKGIMQSEGSFEQ